MEMNNNSAGYYGNIPVYPEIPVIEIGGSQILGTRKTQQDSFGWDMKQPSGELLAVVCDGMGGLSGGELASKITVEAILGKFKGVASVDDPPSFFRDSVRETDLIVHELDDNGRPMNAGTTLVAVHIIGDRLHWLSVGDSHIYIIRHNEIVSICTEHNYGELLKQRLAAGLITQEDYDTDDKRKDALTSYIGMGDVKLMEINQTAFTLQPDDILVLCSDGLFKTLSDQDIMRSVFSDKLQIQRLSQELTELAMQMTRGSQDNTTAIVIHYNGDQFDICQ